MNEELIGRLRAWSRRFDVYSQERRLMLEAAAALERPAAPLPPPPNGITAEMVEAAMGGKKLLPWQRDALGTPPSVSGH